MRWEEGRSSSVQVLPSLFQRSSAMSHSLGLVSSSYTTHHLYNTANLLNHSGNYTVPQHVPEKGRLVDPLPFSVAYATTMMHNHLNTSKVYLPHVSLTLSLPLLSRITVLSFLLLPPASHSFFSYHLSPLFSTNSVYRYMHNNA